MRSERALDDRFQTPALLDAAANRRSAVSSGLVHAFMHELRPASLPSSIFAAPGARGFGINHLADVELEEVASRAAGAAREGLDVARAVHGTHVRRVAAARQLAADAQLPALESVGADPVRGPAAAGAAQAPVRPHVPAALVALVAGDGQLHGGQAAAAAVAGPPA